MSSNMIPALIVLFVLYASVLGGEDEVGIVGGTDAKVGEFPYQISLRLIKTVHHCGGSIIGDKWILTAQHCVFGLKNVTKHHITVVAGTNFLKSGGDVYDVAEVINHEGFTFHNALHDIALLRLSQSIKMNKLVQKIELPTEDTPGDQKVVLTGWGLTNVTRIQPPNKLQKIELKTITNSKCVSMYKNSLFKIHPENVCTLTRTGQGACYGDSGGPLVASGAQVGIVSWGKPCAAGKPDVYTRVYKYVDWIKKHIENK